MEFIKNALGFGAHARPSTTLPDGKIWLDVLVHVQNHGDKKITEGETHFKAPGLRIEGFEIMHTIPDLHIKYMAHIQDKGDTDWQSQGTFVGSRGQSKRLEGFAVALEGKAASMYDVKYYLNMQGVESSPIAKNGEFVGTRGQSRQVEGLAIWLEPKGAASEGESAGAPHMVPYTEYKAMPTGIPATDVDMGGNSEIDQQFRHMCTTHGDIHEHLPTLYKYSLGCTDIAEFGVRSVVSTWAFLRGLRDTNAPRKKLICCDLSKSENIKRAEAAAKNNNIEFEFIEKNDLEVDLKDGVDLLFIDTWHVYAQLIRELNKHAPSVRKYIAMHDTTVDGEHGESIRMGWNTAKQAKESGFPEADIRTGLGKAVREFLETHSDWRCKEVFTNCNGLTILERVTPGAP